MKNFILYLSLFAALAVPFVADAQTAGTSTKAQKVVSGTVTDSEGLPVVGATILVIISVTLTLIAGLIPSRVAAKKDPVIALRTE